MANNNPNVEGIKESSKKKTQLSIQKVEKALREMIRKQMTINFNTVSTTAGVSKGFLYKNSNIRQRIETLREKQGKLPSPKKVKINTSNASKDVIIDSLKKRIKHLEKENEKLEQQLKGHLSKLYQEI
ncbi:DUF6262 family protein [Halobacillus shinanisalinarum]|uniref:DUF6262 family protein n=1 Tax=Halobacillus shinanisalinarum TaxID=2932258 RepID=A0ABY4GW47_9BACI|nr:DUF6262 family protein [Halobacillus shinanisalinarum]UOQ92181.1 DUF6262 family protein [Halobacillus shinanisalinarum]